MSPWLIPEHYAALNLALSALSGKKYPAGGWIPECSICVISLSVALGLHAFLAITRVLLEYEAVTIATVLMNLIVTSGAMTIK